jgi:hypothetical protein
MRAAQPLAPLRVAIAAGRPGGGAGLGMSASHDQPVGGLPYRDSKPQGAADFYFAINATFRFILNRFGHVGFQRYLERMGREYFAVVNRQWQAGGLAAIAEYWRAFFDAEPGADVNITGDADTVRVEVRRCPAIHHLRSAGRAIVPEYCQHCFFLGEARAQAAGCAMRLEGGNGACVHTYRRSDTAIPPQDMERIQKAT